MVTRIPPHVARELRRHVKSSSHKGGGDDDRGGNAWTVVGCVVFTAMTASIPFLAPKWIRPLSDRDEALTSAQIRRGAFNNSGSRDVGRDPMWDFKTGIRTRDDELFANDDPKEIDHGDDYLPDAAKRSS